MLRAANVGISAAMVPLVMVLMNAVFAFSSYPFGKAADRIHPIWLLTLGIVFLFASQVTLALASSPVWVLAAVVLWGLHLGATQGIFSVFIAKLAPEDLRGTAFGLYNLVSGGALLIAGIGAGALWDTLGASASFWAGACFAVISLLFMLILSRGPLKDV